MLTLDQNIAFFTGERAIFLHDHDYYDYILVWSRRARKRIVVAQFLVDARPQFDASREVRGLCHALGEATWRGLDVRVVLNRFLVGDPPLDVNRVAQRFLHRLGVKTRTYSVTEESQRKFIHSKIMLFDDRVVVVGSHNWTANAFNNNHEVSVAVESRDLALRLGQTFERWWATGVNDLESN
jgi:phosphatidylserine/phosphatidylglycerophosphate/cardiolipin synthase-like enzyme